MPPLPVATVELIDDATPVVLVMRGEFDLQALRGVRDPIARLLADPPSELVVDMSQVAFIDSSGIAMLVNIYSHVAARPDGRMRVQGVSPAARRLL
jgi:anti-sigma B factor antagonist